MGCFGTIFLAQLPRETERTRKILTPFLTCRPTKSTVLFLIDNDSRRSRQNFICGVDVADEPVSAVIGNKRDADGLADSTIVSTDTDCGKTGNMANYFQTAALKSGQCTARPAQ